MALELNKQTFDKNINESKVAVVDFWAEWCMPCKILTPILEKIEKDMKGKANFFSVNVDENPELAAKFGIEAIPTVIIFKDGKPVDEMIGVPSTRPEETIKKLINQYL